MPILSDPYQSRLADRTELRPRRDPVLHGERSASPGGTVSAQQVAEYEKNGFLFLPSFFTGGELDALSAERERLLNDQSLRGREEVIVEPDSQAIRSIFAVHQLSDVMMRLASHARLLEPTRWRRP